MAVDPTEELFSEEITESIKNEAGIKILNWGPAKQSINFINAKPALVVEETPRDEEGARFNEDLRTSASQDGDAEPVKLTKGQQYLSDLSLALMVKHSDPLAYYGVKQKKKLEIHDESYAKLRKLTHRKASKETEFRNQMFELIEKTNERVQLDRPFLIHEKMQVIMQDSNPGTPTGGKAANDRQRQKDFLERQESHQLTSLRSVKRFLKESKQPGSSRMEELADAARKAISRSLAKSMPQDQRKASQRIVELAEDA